MNTYPALSDVEPWLFTRIGVSAMHGLASYGYLIERPAEQPAERPPRARKVQPTQVSQYVGVTVHRNRWVAQFGPRAEHRSKAAPLTPEGERQAATVRARALGLSYLERRDGTREEI